VHPETAGDEGLYQCADHDLSTEWEKHSELAAAAFATAPATNRTGDFASRALGTAGTFKILFNTPPTCGGRAQPRAQRRAGGAGSGARRAAGGRGAGRWRPTHTQTQPTNFPHLRWW
jgi:hypothetical protein